MMNYKHFRKINSSKGGFTIAINPIQSWYFDIVKPGDFFEHKFGLAKCHPDDNFNKKIGREISQKKASLKKFTVKKIVDTVGKREITFDVEGFGELVMFKVKLAQSVRFA